MQELKFEQVEEVSGGSKIDTGRQRRAERNGDQDALAGLVCNVIDGAVGGVAGKLAATAFNLSGGVLTAAGVGAGAGVLTPCSTFFHEHVYDGLERQAERCLKAGAENDPVCSR